MMPGNSIGDEVPMTGWRKLRLLVKVVELRLRFIALMGITGATFAYWDEIGNRYEKWNRPAGRTVAAVSGFEHFCPMHPQVVQEGPGSCPICGMPLSKRKKGEAAPLAEGVTARVVLSSARATQAGVKTVQVGYSKMGRTLETVGYVAFDERLLAAIVAKAPGRTRVEKLLVNTTGQKVEVGEVLAELYSPELAQAVRELINASQRSDATKGSRSIDRSTMVQASSEKLKRWGVTQAQIDEILKNGRDDFKIPIMSPIRGFVYKKNVVEGQEVAEGFTMFEVADLKTVWIQAQVFENQLGSVREGQEAEASVEAYPGMIFPGRVEFIQPTLDPGTRATEVRIALENPGRKLLPGMFASVALKSPLTNKSANETASQTLEQTICPVTRLTLGAMGPPVETVVEGRKVLTCCDACGPKLKAEPGMYLARLEPVPADQILSVPESAVIDTGTRKVVYVETEPGVFEGREVILGMRSGDRYPVLGGLDVGENVAAAGAFLIDAESRINPGKRPDATTAPAEMPMPKAKMPSREDHKKSAALIDTDAIVR